MLVISQGLLINGAAELAISQLPGPQIQKTSFFFSLKHLSGWTAHFSGFTPIPDWLLFWKGFQAHKKGSAAPCWLLQGFSGYFQLFLSSIPLLEGSSILAWDSPGARSPKMASHPPGRGSCFKDVIWLFSSSRAPGPSPLPPADPQGSAQDVSNAPSQAPG